MLQPRRRALVADLFCGAGSLSAGANDALIELGYETEFTAVNHWDIATQTYAMNHVGARVHCVSLEAARPVDLMPEGYLDLLMGGIECTYFSRARGGKPVTDQQRMSAWQVVRWCTDLRVGNLLLENVPEFIEWGPVSVRTGKPIKRRKGEYFRAWRDALGAIGHRLECRVVNCADYGDPTTRQRLIMMAAAGGKAVPWPKPSHGKVAQNGLMPWRGAREIIDWSLHGASIFDRKRPLAPKTLARIAAGLVKHRWPEPFLVVLRRHADARGIDLPLPALCAAGTHVGLAQPILLNTAAAIEPFVLSQCSGGAPRGASEPVPTICNEGAHALIAPYYGSGSGLTCNSVEQPLPAATTKGRFGLVVPLTHTDKSNRSRSDGEPLPTLTTANRGELALVTDSPERQHDILFRMLQPHELAAAMSISTAERPYHFVGNKTQVVRQIGQAVPRMTGRAMALALMGAS